MELASAADFAFAALQRLAQRQQPQPLQPTQLQPQPGPQPLHPPKPPQASRGVFGLFKRRAPANHGGGPQAITDYRQSGIHNTLRTASIGVYDRWIVTCREGTAGAIRLTMRDIEARRDQSLAVDVASEADVTAAIEAWFDKIEWWRNRLSIYRLQPGKRYRVIQSFLDYHRRAFEAGTILIFVERHFLPYEGGHTIIFAEANVYLQETENSLIVENFDAYVEDVTVRSGAAID